MCNILADFGVDFRFRKHALSENGNANFFFGVDFFYPAKGILWFFEANRLKTSHLPNPLKIRVFSAKSFLVENFRNMRAISRFREASVLIYFNLYSIPPTEAPEGRRKTMVSTNRPGRGIAPV